MKNKKGFTLIELAVSIVLVSIVLVALIGSLLQIRDAYSVVHENSDVIVYTSSISRVINSDINDNNGIKYVNCSQEGRKCSIILGNDERRELEITEDITDNVGDTETNILHSNNKSTLKYLDTTKYDKTNNPNDKEIVYIRTLELDKYDNETTKVVTSKGYNFADMSASQYEYFENSGNDIEAFTTIEIKLLDGINMDISDYNITLYGAGKYDYSNYVGRIYHIDLNNNEADTAGTTSIDEVFGVGFYKAESNHRKEDEINKIKIPTKEGQAFLGYYYKPAGVTVETKVIDSGGNIVASNRTFKESVELNKEETGVVLAKWGDCEEGFHIVDGVCVQEEFTVTLNKNATGKTCNSVGTTSYKVKYQNKVSDVVAPECLGNVFLGYFSSANKQYHDKDGRGVEYYDLGENTTFNANWHTCEAGEYASYGASNCTSCVKGSYSNAQGSGQCTACPSGKTNSGPKQTECTDCANKNNVLTWKTTTWNSTNNTVTNLCKIQECMTGYHLDSATETCKINTYKITYTLNGGTHGTTHPTTATYNQNVTISNPTRAGYSFKGWTLTNGTSDTAMHGSSAWSNLSTPVKDTTFKNLTKEPDATVTMVANWEECAKGSYNPGGATTCTPCAIGSTTTTTGSTSCSACQASGAAGAGGTTSAAGDTSCNTSCNKAHVSVWETASWNTNNTLTDNCKIKTCATGYTLGSNTCTANTYTISYAGMDGATHGSSHPTTATYDTAFTVNNPSKTGSTFNGWNITGMDSVTHTYGSNTTTNTSINSTKETSFKNLRSTSGIVTFTAGWTINQYTLTIKPNGGKYNNSASDTVIKQNYGTTYTVANVSELAKYTITYNMNGTGITAPTSPTSVTRAFTSWSKSGSGTLDGTTFTFGAGDVTLTAGYNTTSNSFTLPAISKTGYTCKWAEGSASGTQYNGGASRTITANKTYYAVCTINQYTLTIAPNGGTWGGKTTNSTVTQDYNSTYSVAAPTAGPTYTITYNANSQGATYTASPTSVQRPFSSWTKSGTGSLSGTTFTFGAGNGTLTAAYNGTSNSFTLPAISKTGYTCKWAEGSASGTQYAGGSSRTITANTTYYAVCTINQYTLTVAPNGGTWNSSTSNQTFKQDYASTKTIANPTAGPTYTIGYNANSQGATYTGSPTSVQRPFTSWTRSGSGSISGTTYTYGPGDGTLTATYNSTSNSFTLPAITKTGYVCQWAKGSASGTKINGNTATTITGNTTFYASCIIQSYNLVVNPNGGTWNGSTASQTFTQEYNSTKTIAAPTANATYTISYNANSQGATYTASPTSVARAFTGWTKSGTGTWNASTNTFTFGNGTGTLTAAYNGTSASFTLPSISKTGYTCKWAQGSASGTQYAGGTSRTITANTTFYAVCTINQYTLTINPNGGTWGGKTTNSTVTQNYNTTYTVANPTAGPTYTISYNANSQGATYTASPTSVQRPFTSWTKSGTGSISGTTFTFGAGAGTLTAAYNGTSASFTLPTITKSGSICKWAEGSATGTQYAGGTARTITGNTTYYAVCIATSILTINLSGGSWSGGSTTKTGIAGQTVNIPNPTGPTYTISYNANGQGATYTASPTSATIPYDSWSLIGDNAASNYGTLSGTTYTFGTNNAILTAIFGTPRTTSMPDIDCAGLSGTALAQCMATLQGLMQNCDGTYCYTFEKAAYIKLPAISKTGYTCRWAKGSSSGTTYSGNGEVPINANTTFYAKCEKITYSDEPYAFQYDPGDSWYCHYERAHRDGGYFCLSESDVEQFGIFHGGSAVSNTTYCYYCCRESYNGLPYQGQSGGYCQYYVN